jgi:Flp pilus assembly protein TadG
MTGHLRRPRRGQALVEFALVLPLLILLLVGVLDFGRAIFAYNSLSNAARSGAREAIVDQNPAAIRDAATSEAVGLDPLDVDVTYEVGCATPEVGCVVTVEVTHEWHAATPILGTILGPITIASDSKMPIEREYSSATP